MPRITRLERTGDDAVLVHLDGQPFRPVPVVVVASLDLRVDRELGAAEVGALVAAAERAEALDAALRFLSWRARSRAELARHLGDRGHPALAAEAAIRRCEELGYVDDLSFALSFVRDRIRLRPRGRRSLLSELRARGVEPAIAEEAVRDAFAALGTSERELLRRVAAGRARALASLDPERARRRLSGYLLRRGFAVDEVRAVVDELLEARRED